MQFDLVVRAARAIVEGRERAVEIGITGARVAAIDDRGTGLTAPETLELAAGEALLPGLVDAHVHVCDPGRTDWEDFEHATRAAAAGGITTIVDMPIDCVPPTVDVPSLESKRRAAAGHTHVDVAFWGGLVPGNLAQLRPMLDAGARGFKGFLGETGVDEFARVTIADLEAALAALAPLDVPVLVHAENAEAAAAIPVPHGARYADYLRARPRGIENLAIAEVIEVARRTGGRVHVVHLSSSDALPMIESARRDGVRLTVETCPHYLALAAEEVPDGGTPFKCSPPIRESANRDALWDGLAHGLIDQVVSDHSPSTPAMKRLETGDFADAWGGISSLQLALPVVWTAAAGRGFALADVARWMAEAPARLAGLEAKGAIRVGADADLVVLAPDASFVVDPAALHHRNRVTPYAGRTLRGVVRATYLRGRLVDGRTALGREVDAAAPAPAAAASRGAGR